MYVRWPVSRVLCRREPAMTIPLGRSLPSASRDLPGRRSGNGSCAVPIWSCSRWGLPCRLRCRSRGALLPHHFTLASPEGGSRYDFCGAVPGVTPGGCYPSPCSRGARTFLEPPARPAAIRPSDVGTIIECGWPELQGSRQCEIDGCRRVKRGRVEQRH